MYIVTFPLYVHIFSTQATGITPNISVEVCLPCMKSTPDQHLAGVTCGLNHKWWDVMPWMRFSNSP